MNLLALDDLLQRALNEDLGQGDVTSEAIFSPGHSSRGFLLAKQEFVLAGGEVFARVFELLDARVGVTFSRRDGEAVKQGERFADLAGPTRSILSGERVALNFLQHLSGVATLTRRFVDLFAGRSLRVLDTRKTTPLLRDLEKRAIRHGGGHNHRRDLSAMALIKENHIEMAGSIRQAVSAIRSVHPQLAIEVEVKNLAELREALAMKPEVIMLDNFDPELTAAAVAINPEGTVYEISGNVSLANALQRVPPGIDCVSIGALTHSAPVLDLSLLVQRK